MIQAFELKITGVTLSVKRKSQVTTNAKNQYYATVATDDMWAGRNISILWNGVGTPVIDGVCILPQLTAEQLTIGVLSVDDDSLYNTENRNFIVLNGADSATAEVPTTSEWETYALEVNSCVDLAKSYAQNPPKSVENESNWFIWNGTEYIDSGVPLPQGGGGQGVDGATFTPIAAVDGATLTVSWSNDGGLVNPDTVEITAPTGATGATGKQGIQGVKGDTGEAGSKGDKGDKGDAGEQGVQGVQGLQGVPGANGADFPYQVLTESEYNALDSYENKLYVIAEVVE